MVLLAVADADHDLDDLAQYAQRNQPGAAGGYHQPAVELGIDVLADAAVMPMKPST